jgi:oligoendopeptidase F
LSPQILGEGEPAVARYLDFLSGGGSDYPLSLLRQVGVDLSTAAPIQAAMTVFADALNELETLLAQSEPALSV